MDGLPTLCLMIGIHDTDEGPPNRYHHMKAYLRDCQALRARKNCIDDYR